MRNLSAVFHRFLAVSVLLFVLALLAGCGGSNSSSPPPVNDTLFVPNYISSLNGLYHWNHLPMLARFKLPADWSVLYRANPDLHIDGANQWNITGRHTMISVVPMSQTADVTVYFVHEKDINGNSGLTEYTYDSTGRMRSATIKVALYNSHGTLSAIDTEAVIAHELGHALGISGHSPNAQDLLYPTHIIGTHGNTTVRDLNTAMSAYPSYFSDYVTPQAPATRGPVEIYHGVIE